jgi:hypothetical protein
MALSKAYNTGQGAVAGEGDPWVKAKSPPGGFARGTRKEVPLPKTYYTGEWAIADTALQETLCGTEGNSGVPIGSQI